MIPYYTPRSAADLARPSITLTGIDSKVDPEDLIKLSDSGAELGFLYTYDREGRNRYLNRDWAGWTQLSLAQRAALHVCGRRAYVELLQPYGAPFTGLGNPYWSPVNELGALGGQANLLRSVQRIQLNGRFNVDQIEQVCELYPHHIVITQHTHLNVGLLKVRAANHALLVDGSGGTGKSPDKWVAPETDKAVGYAGGLGSDNLTRELDAIQAVARPGWWVDMENKLRTDDWFDVTKALECVRLFNLAV